MRTILLSNYKIKIPKIREYFVQQIKKEANPEILHNIICFLAKNKRKKGPRKGKHDRKNNTNVRVFATINKYFRKRTQIMPKDGTFLIIFHLPWKRAENLILKYLEHKT